MRVNMKACAERRRSMEESLQRGGGHSLRSARGPHPPALRAERAVCGIKAWVLARVFLIRLNAAAEMSKMLLVERVRR